MYEIVERKGLGHPDTLTDMAVEACAKALDAYYLENYGTIYHYNVDKAMFLGGQRHIDFNYLTVSALPTFILGGQVSKLTAELKFKLADVIRTSIRKILPELNFNVEIRSSKGSSNLVGLSNEFKSNDTSFAVGYFPLSKVEIEVFSIEKILHQFAHLGLDYKILNTEKETFISVPVNYTAVKDLKEYQEYLSDIANTIKDFTKKPVHINSEGGAYLTYSGSSIECGDDGQVGRGNRFNGLITPCRPMTMEAYSGKNNQTHIGKLYQKLAFELARQRYLETGIPTKALVYGVIGHKVSDYKVDYSNLEI